MSDNEDLDALTEMLKVIQANESKPKSSAPADSRLMFNSNMTADQINEARSAKEESESNNPNYEFTVDVIGGALEKMSPLMLEEHPFEVLTERLGLNNYLLKKHLADTMIMTFKALPPELSLALVQDINNGALFLSMMTYVFTEAIFIASEATAKKRGENTENNT